MKTISYFILVSTMLVGSLGCLQPTRVITTVYQGGDIVYLDTVEYSSGTFSNDIMLGYNVDSIAVVDTNNVDSQVVKNTFLDVIGVNASLTSDVNMKKAYAFNNQRVFYLIDHDLHGVPMTQRFPLACEAKCPNISDENGAHWNDGNGAWVYRMCDYSKHFGTITLSVSPFYYPDGNGGIEKKDYPNISLSLKNMGGNPYEYGKKYGELLKTSMSQFADDVDLYVEVANEPHGSPSYDVMTMWSKGMRDGLYGSGIKLVSQDCQNVGDDTGFNGTALFDDVSKMDTSLFDVLQTHSYIPSDKFLLTLPPETSGTKWQSPLEEMKSMRPFLGKKDLWLTEFGYDSELLGEEGQAAYIVRTIVLAMRHGFSKAFVYSITDEAVLPFKNCGILYEDGREKQSYIELIKLITYYKDYYFLEVVKETDGEYIYKFTDGNNILLISWDISDKVMPRFEIIK